MTWLEQLELHLRDLYLNNSSYDVDAFKLAFCTFFDEEHQTFRLKMFHNLDQLRLQLERKNIHEVNGKQLNEEILHEHEIKKSFKLQSQDVQINPVQAVDDILINKSLVTESTTFEANLNTNVKALDAGSVITESSGTKSNKLDTRSSSGNYTTHAVDADISPVNEQVPFAEIQLTAQHNVLANEQQHTKQSEPIYDTYLLKKDAKQYQVKNHLLNAEFFKTKDMVEKEVYNELSNRFLQLEKHCISLEILIQQKEESFQSNKPCKNQDSPKFHKFFEINKLKAQLQAKNSTINNLKKQINNVHEKSNEAKVKHDIDVIETINIELEHKVAKLLQENEHLKQTYKELYDSIKKTRIQTKDHNDSLIAQVNSKTVENADLKAQIQEKVFANVALKNELRKLKGNNMDTKFAKPSILGKPVLQPPRNQSVVRQPNAFKSERPNFSKPRFASQVDVNNVLSKPVTPHYLPKVREYVLAKPHHVIAPGSFRNSQEEPYGSNDMAHNHYLEEARKKTQERNRNSKPSVMHTTSLQNTTNGSKPNTRSNNQISRSLPVSKSSCGMSNGVSLGVKSISLTEAEEEAVAREVHATHARIVSGPDPEPVQEDQTGSNSGKLHVSLAGPNPEHMDDEFLATAYPKVHENLKLITDERVIEENPESHSGSMSSMKNLDDTYNFGDQFLYDKLTEDDQEKSKVIEESDSTIPDPSHQTVTSTLPVIAPFTDVSSTKPSSLVTPPPINTEATTIITSLPEITPFISLQLRVARLEQEMSEVKKTDHSTN
ncbi:hypothetical protein Tco_0561579 [Tanacetum coccineum]